MADWDPQGTLMDGIRVGISRASLLSAGDLLREIITGLVPHVCGVNVDPAARREVMHELALLFSRYSGRCWQEVVDSDSRKR